MSRVFPSKPRINAFVDTWIKFVILTKNEQEGNGRNRKSSC